METVKTINLLNGSRCDIQILRGVGISKAINKFQKQKELDIVPFLMVESCLVDGESKSLDFYLNLLSDDYMQITEVIAGIMEKLNINGNN